MVVVGMADLAVSNDPGAVLTTRALGACLGVAVFDPVARVGGVLHTMLPDSGIDGPKAAATPSMFVDSGVAALLKAVEGLGARTGRLNIYAAGGGGILDSGALFDIGGRNVEAFKAFLKRNSLSARGLEAGGLANRTLYLEMATGEAGVKVSGRMKEVRLC
jgi:chemotaxis protein CheD